MCEIGINTFLYVALAVFSARPLGVAKIPVCRFVFFHWKTLPTPIQAKAELRVGDIRSVRVVVIFRFMTS